MQKIGKNLKDKIIIEVGSASTKIDRYNGEKMIRLETKVIQFKKNYNKQNKLEEQDVNELINIVNKYKKDYDHVYVCGTSIFRNLTDDQIKEFMYKFKKETETDFEIISQEKENEITVKGATKNLKCKVAVFVGGGGSTEIAIYENGIKEMINTKFGVIDIMQKFQDLADDFATTDLETIKTLVKERLNIPKNKADILILAGGGHLNFALNSGVSYEKNTLYKDEMQPIMMDIETRIRDTERYYTEIYLDGIRKRVSDPDWWYATRAMTAFVLVVAEELGAKYIVPTDISMANGLI